MLPLVGAGGACVTSTPSRTGRTPDYLGKLPDYLGSLQDGRLKMAAVCVCVRVCVCARVYVCERVSAYARACVCVRACVCACWNMRLCACGTSEYKSKAWFMIHFHAYMYAINVLTDAYMHTHTLSHTAMNLRHFPFIRVQARRSREATLAGQTSGHGRQHKLWEDVLRKSILGARLWRQRAWRGDILGFLHIIPGRQRLFHQASHNGVLCQGMPRVRQHGGVAIRIKHNVGLWKHGHNAPRRGSPCSWRFRIVALALQRGRVVVRAAKLHS